MWKSTTLHIAQIGQEIQCVHKRMVQSQKLTRNLILMLNTGPRAQFQRWRRSRKRQMCAPFWKLSPWPRIKHEKRTAGSAWETLTVAAADGVRFTRVRWEIDFLLTFWNCTILLWISCTSITVINLFAPWNKVWPSMFRFVATQASSTTVGQEFMYRISWKSENG
jgi:hypothetical protein